LGSLGTQNGVGRIAAAKLNRRQVVSRSAIGVAAAAIAGLGQPGSGTARAARALSSQAASTKLSFWHGWTGADNTEMLNTVLDKFNADNGQGITVETTALEWDQLFSKWVVSAASGKPPDVTMYHTSELPEFVQRGITMPIDDLIASAGISLEGVPENVRQASSVDGKLYGVPGDLHPLGLYYNVDLVQAAGLDPAKPPATKDEFLDWAQKLTIRDGSKVSQYGFYIDATEAIPRWFWYSLLYQNGGTFLGPDGKSAVDSPESRDALQFLVDLFHQHKVAPIGSVGSGNDPIATKQGAMWVVGPWGVNQRLRQGLNFKTAAFPTFGKQPAVWANTHCQSISKQKSDERYAADVAFMKWFYDNYGLPADVVGVIPVNPAARASAAFTKSERFPYYQPFIAELDHAVLEPSLPQYTSIFSFAKPTPLRTNLESAIAKRKSVEQALKDMKQGIDEQLAKPL